MNASFILQYILFSLYFFHLYVRRYDSTQLLSSFQKPHLTVTVNQPLSRRRRSNHGNAATDLCPDDSSNPACCRFRLRVNFWDMGWHWIIQPQSYDAYYCSGECDPWQYQTTNLHTRMVYISQHSRRITSGPCCAPTSMDPMSIIYMEPEVDGDQIIIRYRYTVIPNMVVNRCTCH